MNNLVTKLKNHLHDINEDDFRKEWKEIEDLNLQGPTMEEFYKKKFNYFNNNQIISKFEFEKNVPADWREHVDDFGHFSYGYYKAEEI